jgi:aryl-alcohol dehydrogenase-like predicted oxidoreductase
MRYRRLGRTGLEVSRLGLGTMQWGDVVDEHDANEQLTVFLDAGGTLIDTAANYSLGASETSLGNLIGKNNCRDQIVLASKAGFRAHPGGVRRDTSRLSMLRQLDESLERLGTDHLDLWQVHVWDDAVPVEETLATLEHAVRTGRTRYVGLSNYAGWQTAHAHTWLASRGDALPLASTQVEYSLVNRDVENEVVPAALAFGMGVLAWSPLGRGVLT